MFLNRKQMLMRMLRTFKALPQLVQRSEAGVEISRDLMLFIFITPLFCDQAKDQDQRRRKDYCDRIYVHLA
jgi:hypothetical protein